MPGNIKGITVEIGGDTTKLNKALADTSKQSRNIKNELAQVQKALKLDPTNTELLAQKQELLSQAVSVTRDRLSALTQAQNQMRNANAANAGWEQAYEPLRVKIEETTAALNKLSKQEAEARVKLESGEISTEEYSKLKEAMENTEAESKKLVKAKRDLDASFSDGHISDEEYRKFQRELIKTEEELKDLEGELKSGDAAFSKFSAASKEAGDKLDKFSDAIMPVSKAAGALAVGAVAAVEGTEELRTDLSKLDNNARMAGIGVDAARASFEAFAIATDETDSSVEATSNLLQAGFTESNLQKAMEGLTGAYLAFPDTLKIESLADSLQETLATGDATGQFGELLDRLGYGAENFSKNLALCATEAHKQDLALSVLAENGMMASYQGWLENNEELVKNKEASLETKFALSKLAESIQPLVTEVLSFAQSILNWFNALDDGEQKAVMAIVGVTAVMGPLTKALSNIMQIAPNVVTAFKDLGLKGGLVAAAVTVIAMMAGMLIAAWDDMSPLQRAIGVIGILAATILTAAIAMGAFQSAASLGLAAIGIVAGITAVAVAVSSATEQAKKAASDIPRYATGTGYHPGGWALVGEEGAELLELPRGARVYNNRETGKILGGQSDSMGVPDGSNNRDVVDAISFAAAQIIKAISETDRDVYFDGTRLTRAVTEKQKWLAKTKGPSLVR